MPRLKDKYKNEVVPAMIQKFGYKNIMQVPKLEKIVVNMGLGEAIQNSKIIDAAVNDIMTITGQRPVVTKAKKSIAAFKSFCAGMSVGAKVTLRGNRMYEFMDRLVNVALPRVRDFRGLSPKSFDGRAITAWASKSSSSFRKSIMIKSTKPGYGHHHCHNSQNRRRSPGTAKANGHALPGCLAPVRQ